VQVFPRPINFFLIEEGLRERIVPEKGQFLVNNTNQKFTQKEIEELIELSPEKFSPNVILRPVYQEVILPNLCYIGGPSEIAYWFQLKSVFDKYNVDFPILMPRNFGMIINRNIGKKIEKMGFAKSDLFLDFQTLKENYVLENSDNELTLEREFEVLAEVFSSIKHLAGSVDKSLQGFIGAEEAKTIKAITSIEKRIKKAEEQKHDQGLKTIATIKDKLFPNDGLQERTDNILNFYLNNPEIINELILAFDPFDFSFHVFSENE
jgi:bacillithiol biosynthesis cysteine-adding enzyme BshC